LVNIPCLDAAVVVVEVASYRYFVSYLCSACFGTTPGWPADSVQSCPQVVPSWARQGVDSLRNTSVTCEVASRLTLFLFWLFFAQISGTTLLQHGDRMDRLDSDQLLVRHCRNHLWRCMSKRSLLLNRKLQLAIWYKIK